MSTGRMTGLCQAGAETLIKVILARSSDHGNGKKLSASQLSQQKQKQNEIQQIVLSISSSPEKLREGIVTVLHDAVMRSVQTGRGCTVSAICWLLHPSRRRRMIQRSRGDSTLHSAADRLKNSSSSRSSSAPTCGAGAVVGVGR